MENASKALIIAGAILLSILIIAIGMFIFTNAQSTITDTMTSMSKQEQNAFNSQFTGYDGALTGSQVKSLIGDLVTNANTYVEEPGKIISLNCNQLDSRGEKTTTAPAPASPNNIENYVSNLGKMRNAVETKHTYWVELVYGTAGIIDTINISYYKEATNGVEPIAEGTKLDRADS
ncbi:hypothetical protein [uncultured Clostridium sp.]|uniref:hypothetical protein n=1 Tax=uncultured Clostridium sp. TaxID=59620 RepID=UPI0026F1FA61|nr:hypothetical protein [uncultured Clostridium sp.]